MMIVSSGGLKNCVDPTLMCTLFYFLSKEFPVSTCEVAPFHMMIASNHILSTFSDLFKIMKRML